MFYEVRTVSPAEESAVNEFTESLKKHAAALKEKKDPAAKFMDTNLVELFRQSHKATFVATLNGEWVGIAICDVLPDRAIMPSAQLNRLWVEPQWRGRENRKPHIASDLVAACEKAALGNKHTVITAPVNRNNKTAIAFYRRLGFEQSLNPRGETTTMRKSLTASHLAPRSCTT